MKFFIFLALLSVSASLTWQQYRDIEFIAWNFFDNATRTDKLLGQTPAALVRAIFHDAGTFRASDRTGGPRGCLLVACTNGVRCDRNAAENLGLESVIQQVLALHVDPRYKFNTILTRADFFHMLGKIAIEYSSGRTIFIPFQTGRADCSLTNPSFASRLPGGEIGFSAWQTYFTRTLGMSLTDGIALMGAHSMGRAFRRNSNFVGQWDLTVAKFDSGYYGTLLNNRWFRRSIPASNGMAARVQWSAPNIPNALMLHPDINLFWDIMAQNGRCNVTLDGNSCPVRSSTSSIIQSMQNPNNFFNAFAIAFQKLQNNGISTLTPFTGTDPGFGRISAGWSVQGRLNGGTFAPVAISGATQSPTSAGICYQLTTNQTLASSFPANPPQNAMELAFATLEEAQNRCNAILNCAGVVDHTQFAPCVRNLCYTPRAAPLVSNINMFGNRVFLKASCR